MPNPLQLAGAQPPKPSRRAPLYQGARWSTGLWSNRAAVRDAASTRLEEKFYGPRGDAFLGGQNLEITQRLTVGRRPGNSVWNHNNWLGVNSFYEFRLFNANTEQIKTMVDTAAGLYDASNNSQSLIWSKKSGAGQSFMQSVGNTLFWGDGVSQEKWINTLQERIPYVRTNESQNPYNFTPFELGSFIIDKNGNAQQLIGTVLQLSSFYILNNIAVFSLVTSSILPTVQEILEPGLQIYFPPSSSVANALGDNQGVTLTISGIVGGLVTCTVFSGGRNYLVNDIVTVNQNGAQLGTAKVLSITTSAGTGYHNALVPTTSNGIGTGCTLNLTTSGGGLASATVGAGGTGYIVNDYITPIQSGGSGGYFIVTAVTLGVVTAVALVNGVVSTVSIQTPGMGYDEALQVPTTGGTGIGLTVNITDDNSSFTCPVVYGGGPVTSASIVLGGTGYLVGDTITPVEATQPNSTGAELTVTAIGGAAGGLVLVSGGNPAFAYTAGGSLNTTSGLGSGASITINTVSGGHVTAVTVSSGGFGYHLGDLLYITQGSATGCILSVTGVSGTVITSVNILSSGGTAYSVATNVPTLTSGAGTGLTINILAVTAQGVITSFAVNAPGTGYSPGDLIYPSQGGDTSAIIQISSLGGGVATGLTQSILPGHTGYLFGTPLPTTTSGTGTGCTVTLSTQPGVPVRIIATINSGGNGYFIGDTISPTVSGSSNNLSFVVISISPSPGPITAIAVTESGSGYVTSNNLPTSGNTGTGATVNLVVSNPNFFPLTSISDIVNVFSGGNPISDGRSNSSVTWSPVGGTTIDGSALWFNRGATIDGGIVYNWGIASSPNTPSVVVNNAVGGWVANTYYTQWQIIVITVSADNYIMQLQTSGKSGSVAPTWNVTPGQTTTDGTAVWLCLSNDLDTTLAWVADTAYSPGHVLEETVSAVSCLFELQSYTGLMTQGTTFPVYCWQCNSQSGSDVGAAGEIPSGIANAAMAANGGQSTSTATFSGAMNSLFLVTDGTTPIQTSAISGDGTVSGSPTTLFSGIQNLSISMLPTFVVPQAGIYTFSIGHINAMFWGIGNGSLQLNVKKVSLLNNVLTVTFDKNVSSILTTGVDLTFSSLTTATWLNNQTVTVSAINQKSITANFVHANFAATSESGSASTGATLTPSVVSGPHQYPASGSPNTYDFSTGTPLKGYPVMSAFYPVSGTSFNQYTVQISFPSAGVYPVEIQKGFWYHTTPAYTQPTVSPALPATTYDFYMVYAPPGNATNYNIIPSDIATSSANPPTWPAFPATVANMQVIAPDYPSVTEESGNYTWWNLGPAADFGWTASTNYTTNTFVVDQNSFQQVPYVPGVSGTTIPGFSPVLDQLVLDSGSLVWMNNGPQGSSAFGTLTTTQGGWSYAVALVNTLDDTVSNASLISAHTGSFFGATGVYVSGGLPAVIDPQADYVAIFRTQDGGATYFLIPPPASGNGNTEYTLPLSVYLTGGFTDTTPDNALLTLLEAPLSKQNSVPRKGVINLAYQDNRIFVSLGNVVYWSTGPDTPIGNGFNGFAPDNFAECPSKVVKIVPLNIGILVMTVSDIYILVGNGTAQSPFVLRPYLKRLGLLSYNALDVNGSILYFLSTDNQLLELSVNNGVSEIGKPIADIIETFEPTASYVTWHVSGSNDQCLFAADGSTGWYRMCPTPSPENGGLSWSLKANIVGGCGAVQSVETSPGNIQLLLGPPPGVIGPILFRDYSTNEDNGSPYPANFILGSLVTAFPGQVSGLEFITTECLRVANGLPISLGVRLGEVSGPFEDLVYWDTDPPHLAPSESLIAQRFYLSQTKFPALCRHFQIYGEFEETNSQDELLTLTVFGGFMGEA